MAKHKENPPFNGVGMLTASLKDGKITSDMECKKMRCAEYATLIMEVNFLLDDLKKLYFAQRRKNKQKKMK